MNGKKAKALRRQAKEMTIGLPDREYGFEQTTIRKKKLQSGAVVETGTVVLTDCTRKTYKQLKREAKQCRRNA